MKDIAIIGGGASGLMAAIIAARNGAKVVILEHMDIVGKKILATGNGKCNYTNVNWKPEFFMSDNSEFSWEVVNRLPVEETLLFFERLGVYPKNKGGYIYPNSNQASSVREVLLSEVNRLKIDIMTLVKVSRIEQNSSKPDFAFDIIYTYMMPKESKNVKANKNLKLKKNNSNEKHILEDNFDKEFKIQAKKIIIAAGGKSAMHTGSDGSGYKLAKDLGHSVIKTVPALVQLRGSEQFFKQLSGVRIDAKVNLYINKNQIASDNGELQFTDYGISGIPVFQISRYASKAISNGDDVWVHIDFMSKYSSSELFEILDNRKTYNNHKTLKEFFIGMFPDKFISVLLNNCDLSSEQKVYEINTKILRQLTKALKEFKINIVEANSFKNAQVTAGGVNTKEVNVKTLESNIVKSVYFCGEILDVDAICGGYNLQWAWSSGYVAGLSAAMELKA
jgi:flavoprotein, HI0933 family